MPRGPDWNDAVAGKCARPPADAAEGEGMTFGAFSGLVSLVCVPYSRTMRMWCLVT